MTLKRIVSTLLVGAVLPFAALHSENVVVSGLTVRRTDRTVVLTWKANVKNAEFSVYRGYVPLRNPQMQSNALLIAQMRPDGEPEGKLFRFPSFTDTLNSDSPAYYLILPDKPSYDQSDFRPDQNFNTRPAEADGGASSSVAEIPAPAPKGPEEILMDETPEGLRIRVSAIRFAPNRSEIPSESGAVLDKVADIIRKILADPQAHGLGPKIRIEIGGHTDDVGSDSANLALSRKRALAVKNELVKKGLDKTLFSVKGYGETRPVRNITPGLSDAEKEEARTYNRRVEFFIRK